MLWRKIALGEVWNDDLWMKTELYQKMVSNETFNKKFNISTRKRKNFRLISVNVTFGEMYLQYYRFKVNMRVFYLLIEYWLTFLFGKIYESWKGRTLLLKYDCLLSHITANQKILRWKNCLSFFKLACDKKCPFILKDSDLRAYHKSF